MHPSSLCIAAIIASGLIGLMTESLGAEPAENQITLADITLGKQVSGEALTPESLRHRVVLVAFWNRSCKVCREAMQFLEATQHELAAAGLLVVASHTERGTFAEVRQTAEKLGLTVPVVDDSTIAGLARPDPPHVLLFDHTGRCIARGSPREMAAKAALAVQDAPPLVLAGRHLEKLAVVERLMRNEANYGAALRKASEMTASEDVATAAEAAYVVERLQAEAERLLAAAEAVRTVDARAAVELLNRVATAFRGGDAARRAAETQRAWRRERSFTDGLQAASLANQLEAMRAQVLAKPTSGNDASHVGQVASPPAVTRVASMATAAGIPPHAKAAMSRVAAMVRQLGPGSRYAGRAEEIILELGLDVPATP